MEKLIGTKSELIKQILDLKFEDNDFLKAEITIIRRASASDATTPNLRSPDNFITSEKYMNDFYECFLNESYAALYGSSNVRESDFITDSSFTEKNWKNSKQLLNITLNLEAAKPQTILS